MSGKRSKKLVILAGILGAACIVTLLLLGIEQKKEDIRVTGESILEIPIDTITALKWQTGHQSPISLHKVDDTWVYDDDESFPVDGDRIASMLEQFESFSSAFVIEKPEELSEYGLSDPTAVIEITADNDTKEIKLGDFSAMDSQRYVSIGDGNVYLMAHDPMKDFDVSLSDLILHDKIPWIDQIQTLNIVSEDPITITYREKGGPSLREDDNYFTLYHNEEVPLDNFRVEGLLQDLSYMTLHDYVTYHATDEELEQYGLKEPQLSLTANFTDENDAEQEFTIHISRDPKEAAKTSETDDDDEITAFARVGDSPIIYQISGTDYTALMSCTYNDLRHHEILPVEYSSIAQVHVELDDSDYTLSVKDYGDNPLLLYQDKEFDGTDFQNALTALTAQKFTDERSNGKTEISVVLTLADDAETNIRIDLERFDGSYCLATVDGKPLALVDRSQVVNLIEAINTIVLDAESTEAAD